jgi:hypothetical protein
MFVSLGPQRSVFIYHLNMQFLSKGDTSTENVWELLWFAFPIFFCLLVMTGKEIEIVRKIEMAMKMEMTREMEMGSEMERGED